MGSAKDRRPQAPSQNLVQKALDYYFPPDLWIFLLPDENIFYDNPLEPENSQNTILVYDQEVIQGV